MAEAFSGAIVPISRDIPSAEAAANAVLNDFKARHVEDAYAGAGRSFMTSQNLTQFHEFVKNYDGFRTNTSRSFDSNMINQTTCSKRASFKMALTVLEENGQWKVDRIRVPWATTKCSERSPQRQQEFYTSNQLPALRARIVSNCFSFLIHELLTRCSAATACFRTVSF